MSRREVCVWVFLAVLVVTVSRRTTAQNVPPPAGAEPPAKERHKPLPAYFGKIGTTDEQKTKLYAIQEAYAAKIAPLTEQIRLLEEERDTKMEALLSPGQKLRMQELKDEARAKAEARKATSDEAPSEEAGSN